MDSLITVQEAIALFPVSEATITDLCRKGWLHSAHKARPATGGMACWWIDRAELRRYLYLHPPRPNDGRPEPWTPRYRRPARAGEPTELQYQVLAGETWHDLVDLELRADGDLWTRWSDGERFLIHPNGELDAFRYERVGVAYLQAQKAAREKALP